jgi:hypothetical protein
LLSEKNLVETKPLTIDEMSEIAEEFLVILLSDNGKSTELKMMTMKSKEKFPSRSIHRLEEIHESFSKRRKSFNDF